MKKLWVIIKKRWKYESPRVAKWIINIGISIAAISSAILATDPSWVPESYLPIARHAFGISVLISALSKLTVTKKCAEVIDREVKSLEIQNKI